MQMKSLRLALVACGFAAILPVWQTVAENAGGNGFPQFVLDYDPSSVAMTNDHKSEHWPQTYLERWRIVTDLNGDGKDDLILSDDPGYFGNGGGPWSVYISSNGYWRCIGDVGMYPGVFAMDKVGDAVELWYFWNKGGHEGYIGYYTFGSDVMVGDGGGARKILVGSDDDDNSLFTCLDKAIFGYAHRHPYRFEKSETSTNGVVSWKVIGDWRKPSRSSELHELRRELAETTKKLAESEAKVAHLERKLKSIEPEFLEVCGVTLGSKWKGGSTSMICREDFSGFTNMTVHLDGNGYVNGIRLTRDEHALGEDSGVRGWRMPNPTEWGILQQIEDKWGHKMKPGNTPGTYFWDNLFYSLTLQIRFVRDGESSIEVSCAQALLNE